MSAPNPYLAHLEEEESVYSGRKYPRLGFVKRDAYSEQRSYYAPPSKDLQTEENQDEEEFDIEEEFVDDNVNEAFSEYNDNKPHLDWTHQSEPSSKHALFVHGNYSSYYGYRSSSKTRIDSRMALFDPEWFRNKRVLDIGCNAGHVTLNIAMHLRPALVEGVDIDPSLIRRAKYLHATRASLITPSSEGECDANYFPISCTSAFGTLPLINVEDTKLGFPHNVDFRVGDWVHERFPQDDSQMFDVVLALSVTKWIHLNGGKYESYLGDGGIRYFFRKVVASLLPGGRFILEPQPFQGYQKRSNLTDKMRHNFSRIKLVPEQFPQHLQNLGLALEHTFQGGKDVQKARGFQRPMFVFIKPL